jgi:hypothetical protein
MGSFYSIRRLVAKGYPNFSLCSPFSDAKIDL